MSQQSTNKLALFGSVLALTMLAAGCATKKYVRNQVDPLEARLGNVSKKTDENSTRINDVDRKAEAGVSDAQSRADAASKAAAQADEHAQNARGLAEKGMTRIDAVSQEVENADNFQPVKTETVLFDFNKSELTPEDKQQLDQVAESAKSMKHYLIAVQGYTDSTGPQAYNLELSRRRSDAVVRYLTETRNIPLVRISQIGYGEDAPAQPNNTRDGRKQNRRVEVRLLTPQQAGAQAEQPKSSASINK
jgi:outer membrane protein OmpA-like peptidoglycan-associated protein